MISFSEWFGISDDSFGAGIFVPYYGGFMVGFGFSSIPFRIFNPKVFNKKKIFKKRIFCLKRVNQGDSIQFSNEVKKIKVSVSIFGLLLFLLDGCANRHVTLLLLFW